MNRTIIAVLAPLVLLSACASGSSVLPQLVDARGTMRAADEMGASKHPDAALHLKLAEENTRRGVKLLEEGEPKEARRALESAELDAELAIALVNEHETRARLQNINNELEELNHTLRQN